MNLLKELSDVTIGLGEGEQLGHPYELRKTARGIVQNEAGDIAIQYLGRDHFHKLPGGGVDQGETIEEALVREVQEEVGCACTIEKNIGIVIEYRNEHNLIQISYGFSARVEGNVGKASLEQAEIDEEMITLWMKPEDAVAKMKVDSPLTYQGHFILERELAFLEEYLNSKSNS